jgi:hypothetical protein
MVLKTFIKVNRKLREERERRVAPEEDCVELYSRLESDHEIPLTCYQGLYMVFQPLENSVFH